MVSLDSAARTTEAKLAVRYVLCRTLFRNIIHVSFNLSFGSRSVHRWIFVLSSNRAILHSIRWVIGIAWNSDFDYRQGKVTALCPSTIDFKFIALVYGRRGPMRFSMPDKRQPINGPRTFRLLLAPG